MEWTCKTIVSVLTPQTARTMFTCGWTDCRAVNIAPTNMAGANVGFLTCVVNHSFTVVISRRNSDTRSLDDQFNFEVIVVSHLHHFLLTSSTDQTIQSCKCKLVFIVKTPLVEVKQIQIVQHLLILIQFVFK